MASKPSSIPMDPTIPLSLTTGSLLENPTFYLALIGTLLYLMIIYPDITFDVNRLSQFLSVSIEIELLIMSSI